MSDHAGLFFNFLCYTSKIQRAKYNILWNKGDYHGMNEMISNIQWEAIHSNWNADEQWYTFTHKVNVFAYQLIPRR